MTDRPKTPERLPKPIDEMSDDEFWNLFPETKPLCAKVVGDTALGPLVALPDALVKELHDAAEPIATDDR